MVIMSQEAYEKFLPRLHDRGVLIVDSTIVKPDKLAQKHRVYRVPATELAEKLGRRIDANVILLGFLGRIWDAVSVEALQEAVKARVPRKYLKLNLYAFQAGIKLAEEALKRKGAER